MMNVRLGRERGRASYGWLEARYTFSFGDYYDPQHIHFRALRVINEDRVAPGAGFGMHPHKDMEILTYILEGSLEHQDSLGTKAVIKAGEIQRITAGTGIFHSEYNPSKTAPVHLLQIWILPGHKGLPPSYEERVFAPENKRGRLCLIASADGRDGSALINQDIAVWATLLEKGERVAHALARGRHAWVHVANGAAIVNGQELRAGDAAAISEEEQVELVGEDSAELLVFDLA